MRQFGKITLCWWKRTEWNLLSVVVYLPLLTQSHFLDTHMHHMSFFCPFFGRSHDSIKGLPGAFVYTVTVLTFLVFLTSAEWSLCGCLWTYDRKDLHQIPLRNKVLKYCLMSGVRFSFSFSVLAVTLLPAVWFPWDAAGRASPPGNCYATSHCFPKFIFIKGFKSVPFYLNASKLEWSITCARVWEGENKTRQGLLSFQSTNPTDC